MKKTTSKKILNYTAMSAALLGVSSVSGQIIYTDVEPDEIINTGESLNIDINDDGINDFSAHVIPGNASGYAARFITTPDVDPIDGANGSNGNGFLGVEENEYLYASNLVAGTVIEEICDGVVDGYIGVSLNLEGNTHFGWIRLDLTADATVFTIKDFAIESTPDTAIEAGDMGDELSLEDNVIEGLSTYVVNDALTINAINPIENVTIYNLSGQEVIARELNNTTEVSIDLNSLSTAAYIASIQSEGTITAIKFVK